jgi:hypothetical protein
MSGTAAWFLTVTLWSQGPQVVSGPYTEAECMSCGEAWLRGSEGFVRRNPRLYPGFPLFSGRSWACFEHYPTDPPVQVSFPSKPKMCEAK